MVLLLLPPCCELRVNSLRRCCPPAASRAAGLLDVRGSCTPGANAAAAAAAEAAEAVARRGRPSGTGSPNLSSSSATGMDDPISPRLPTLKPSCRPNGLLLLPLLLPFPVPRTFTAAAPVMPMLPHCAWRERRLIELSRPQLDVAGAEAAPHRSDAARALARGGTLTALAVRPLPARSLASAPAPSPTSAAACCGGSCARQGIAFGHQGVLTKPLARSRWSGTASRSALKSPSDPCLSSCCVSACGIH
jgi:hypothetical protein